jgi:hypothetical protein
MNVLAYRGWIRSLLPGRRFVRVGRDIIPNVEKNDLQAPARVTPDRADAAVRAPERRRGPVTGAVRPEGGGSAGDGTDPGPPARSFNVVLSLVPSMALSSA